MVNILLVDDQVNVRRSTAMLLQQDGHSVREATGRAEALTLLSSTKFDVVVTDVRMEGDQDGAAVLRSVKAHDADTEVIIMTAFGTIDDAVDAMRMGAYDYLSKPLDPGRLLITVRRAAERRALAREVHELRAQVGAGDRIIAASNAMQQVLRTVAKVASTDSTVLVTGESGTGKDLVAAALHAQSSRKAAKFVPINCGGITETILESELFGHRKGAFTGAVSDKKGLFEEAHKGTLFLDEIGEMPLMMQVRLLRFLQAGEVRRIGDTDTRRVDVRVILATHRDLEAEVAAGRFRQDFYYRINVVTVHVPPLRERPDDVEPLVHYFVRRLAARLGRPVRGVSPGALDLLTAYAWPGNVRELKNALERALNLASGDIITEADLPAALTVTAPPPKAAAPRSPAVTDRERLLTTLDQYRWNQSRAAASLGISRTTLWRKLRELRLDQ
jgi:DNA-binding NtrC family response regulator